MSILSSLSRLLEYYRRHGAAATLGRAKVAGKRALVAGRLAVFYCDLAEQKLSPINIPENLQVRRLTSLEELGQEHLQTMVSFWNPKLAERNIRERFEKGASLWLAECEEQLAGYGWTMRGKTIAPYYFPLGPDDEHLFDFHVFPNFRGRGINPCLVDCILDHSTKANAGRAFIEAAEWNEAQLSSLRKTPFRCLGLVRSITLCGHTFVSWTRNAAVLQPQNGAESTKQIMVAVKPNER
jgi:ribosomal protein S18 acetylase RimI-like enzyme